MEKGKLKFYAIVDVVKKNKKGEKVKKQYVETFHGFRHVALNELSKTAKQMGGKISYFGLMNKEERKFKPKKYTDDN